MKFDPHTQLIPAIIQDAETRQVLMMAYMNKEAFDKTLASGMLTFWSRSRSCLWTKGETSGNVLQLISWSLDCDEDTLLFKVKPAGPVCHKGHDTCWNEINEGKSADFLDYLEKVIDQRYTDRTGQSYTSKLFDRGVNKIAQKVGEEAVELIIEAKDNHDDLFTGEAADLLFHFLVLLRDRGMNLGGVISELKKRHRS